MVWRRPQEEVEGGGRRKGALALTPPSGPPEVLGGSPTLAMAERMHFSTVTTVTTLPLSHTTTAQRRAPAWRSNSSKHSKIVAEGLVACGSGSGGRGRGSSCGHVGAGGGVHGGVARRAARDDVPRG